ncbi:MAG: hypothetical protein HQL87_18060 [Magnetococcales bacterium]|nr:hypothetical protein [Magnetococcales bacterium]
MGRRVLPGGRCLAVVLCLIAGLSVRPAQADRVDLQPLDDALLVDLLTTADLVVEEDRSHTLLRVYRLREEGLTCAHTPDPCPNERLFIALAAHHGDSTQQVFVLPYAYGWKNPRLVEHATSPMPCSTLIPRQFIKLAVERVEQDGQAKPGEISFNMYEAQLSMMMLQAERPHAKGSHEKLEQ